MENCSGFLDYLYCNEYSVIINFSSTLIGAFLGFFFALIIYWITERSSKRKNIYEAELYAYNTLNRFSTLIKDTINVCKKQNEDFEEYSKDIISKPLSIPLLPYLATYNRTKLAGFDTIELYHSFILFNKDNSRGNLDYQNIFKNADFLDMFYSDLINQDKLQHNFMFSDLKSTSNNLLSLVFKLGLILRSIEKKHPNDFLEIDEYKFILKYLKIYNGINEKEFPDFELVKSEFLIPFKREFINVIADEKIVEDLILIVMSINTTLRSAELNALAHANIFAKVKDNSDVISALSSLESIMKTVELFKEPKYRK
jgi:hypothetical protein